jgi:hypothetical protein
MSKLPISKLQQQIDAKIEFQLVELIYKVLLDKCVHVVRDGKSVYVQYNGTGTELAHAIAKKIHPLIDQIKTSRK